MMKKSVKREACSYIANVEYSVKVVSTCRRSTSEKRVSVGMAQRELYLD